MFQHRALGAFYLFNNKEAHIKHCSKQKITNPKKNEQHYDRVFLPNIDSRYPIR